MGTIVLSAKSEQIYKPLLVKYLTASSFEFLMAYSNAVWFLLFTSSKSIPCLIEKRYERSRMRESHFFLEKNESKMRPATRYLVWVTM